MAKANFAFLVFVVTDLFEALDINDYLVHLETFFAFVSYYDTLSPFVPAFLALCSQSFVYAHPLMLNHSNPEVPQSSRRPGPCFSLYAFTIGDFTHSHIFN